MTTHPGTAPRSAPHAGARHFTVVLIALLAAAVLALSIAIVSSGGDSGRDSGSVKVAPQAPLPPSPAERKQPLGLNGPGMRP
jgi:hypothetical protein